MVPFFTFKEGSCAFVACCILPVLPDAVKEVHSFKGNDAEFRCDFFEFVVIFFPTLYDKCIIEYFTNPIIGYFIFKEIEHEQHIAIADYCAVIEAADVLECFSFKCPCEARME